MISEDGNFVLNYNGEIYNFLQLRKELEGLGRRFVSRTDSEVVLRSFMEWGAASVERFCGIFAFAIWSKKSGKLFLARDPLGMKPLYYAALPGEIGAQAFHHTRRRGAGLRPECATELASAHPDCFRQMFEGKRFGDVIAGVADGGGNAIVLRCQIDGGCEL